MKIDARFNNLCLNWNDEHGFVHECGQIPSLGNASLYRAYVRGDEHKAPVLLTSWIGPTRIRESSKEKLPNKYTHLFIQRLTALSDQSPASIRDQGKGVLFACLPSERWAKREELDIQKERSQPSAIFNLSPTIGSFVSLLECLCKQFHTGRIETRALGRGRYCME